MLLDELYKEKIPDININKNKDQYIICIFCCLIILYLVCSFKYYINIIILSIVLFVFIIDDKLKTNSIFSKKNINIEEIYNYLNTGDIIFLRCYTNELLEDFLMNKCFSPLFQTTYFTHTGMVYKANNGKIYIIENNENEYFCELNKKKKAGTTMTNIFNRLMEPHTRFHIIKSNMHKYIDHHKLYNSIHKYMYTKFDIYNFNCIDYIKWLLYENGLLKLPNNILNRYLHEDIINASNYNVNIKFEEPIIINPLI
jgi:hypothetical protein